MGHWGLKMKKPTILMMNMPEVFEHGLKKDMPNGQNIVKDWGAKKSGRWVAGTKNLADSAAYPERYCEEIAELFELSTTFKKEDLQNDSIWESTCGLKDASCLVESRSTRKPRAHESSLTFLRLSSQEE